MDLIDKTGFLFLSSLLVWSPVSAEQGAPVPANGQRGTDKSGTIGNASFDDYICPRCEDLLTKEIVAKHFPQFAPFPSQVGPQICTPQCTNGSGREGIVVSPRCGVKNPEANLQDQGPVMPETGLPTTIRSDKENFVAITVWDDDTPCGFGVGWQGPHRLKEALALAKDIAAVATPALMSRHTYEAVVIGEDATGDKAKALLAKFDKLRPAVDALLPLSPGFPKIVDRSTHADLPADKKSLLLAYCPNMQGDQMMRTLRPLFPDITFHRIVAGNTPVACSRFPEGWGLATTESNDILKSGKREMRVAWVADDKELAATVPVHRQSPVEGGYFAHAIPGEIDSPRTRPAIASEVPVT